METQSSLLLRNRATSRALAVALLCALTACGDDDGANPNGPGPDGAADAAMDAPSTTVDAGHDDAGGAVDAANTNDGARNDVASGRDTTADVTADNASPTDVRNDFGNGNVDARADMGNADTGGGNDAARDVTVDTTPPIDSTVDTSGPMSDAGNACTLCASYGSPEQAGKITSSTLNALSGISVSKNNAGVVYVHNDRNVDQFFAVSESGALLGTFNVTGAPVDDIEDMAVAHCPSGSCVYLADIGGNISPRTQFGVVRVPEPQVDVNTPGGTTSIAGEKLVFSYPDNANHNAESILVDPASDTIYVITKVAAGMPSAVYKFPTTFGGSALTATKVIDLTVPKSSDKEAVSASAHPCAPAFLLRTYNTLYEFRAAPGATLEAAFSATPTVVPVATESQGEGVAYRPDGRGYFTTTEGSQPPLNRVGCQ